MAVGAGGLAVAPWAFRRRWILKGRPIRPAEWLDPNAGRRTALPRRGPRRGRGGSIVCSSCLLVGASRESCGKSVAGTIWRPCRRGRTLARPAGRSARFWGGRLRLALSTAAALPKDRRGDELKVPAADVVEGLVAALLSATIGSVFATMDAALGSLNPSRLSALDEESKASSRRGCTPTSRNPRPGPLPVAGRSRRVYGALRGSGRDSSHRSSLTRLSPRWARSGRLTYGTLAEVGTTLGRGRPTTSPRRSSRSSGHSSCWWSRSRDRSR